MNETPDQASRWVFGGRRYELIAFSDVSARDGYGWELNDVAPTPGRGKVLEAFWDDTTGLFSFWACGGEALPFELVEQFVMEARSGVPPQQG